MLQHIAALQRGLAATLFVTAPAVFFFTPRSWIDLANSEFANYTDYLHTAMASTQILLSCGWFLGVYIVLALVAFKPAAPEDQAGQ